MRHFGSFRQLGALSQLIAFKDIDIVPIISPTVDPFQTHTLMQSARAKQSGKDGSGLRVSPTC